MPEPTVCISIVTYNSSRYIRRCLESVLRQSGVRLDIVVVDNASADGTREILDEFGDRIRVIPNSRNVGFAAAQNQGIRASRGEWVLTLNPDLLMDEDFLSAAGGSRGTGSGDRRGMRQAAFDRPRIPAVEASGGIDSTGIFFTPAMRHFDRGWNEPDDGAYDQPRVRVRSVRGGGALPAADDRRCVDRWRFLRSRFLCLPRGCRRGVARAIARVAVHLHSGGGGVARAQRAARQPAVDLGGNQHALGEEPLPDADQELDGWSVPSLSGCRWRRATWRWWRDAC